LNRTGGSGLQRGPPKLKSRHPWKIPMHVSFQLQVVSHHIPSVPVIIGNIGEPDW
jgi:hypothetical protein